MRGLSDAKMVPDPSGRVACLLWSSKASGLMHDRFVFWDIQGQNLYKS